MMEVKNSKINQAAAEYLRNIISKHTLLPIEEIKPDKTFDSYGIDSILMVSMIQELEDEFGEMSKTLFFENQNLIQLNEYFVENYPQQLIELLDLEEESIGEAERTEAPVERPSIDLNLSSNELKLKNQYGENDIAIIGIAGRLPQADTLYEFWTNIKSGKDCIEEISDERWCHKAYFDEQPGLPGKTYSKWSGMIKDFDRFDPLFFNLSNLEAESLDPQERLFMQVVHHTLEDAGYTRQSLSSQVVGMYVGLMWGGYQFYGTDLANAGSSYASIANRASYHFNFSGPSIALDTMCSSSLMTVHLACQSIQLGECDSAIAGGVNVTTHPYKYLFLSKTGFSSSHGRCKSFGEGGDGYVPADGVGAVFLKPLRKAIEEGDYIYGVVRASVANHDGKTNGYFVPNPRAQGNLIKAALKKSGVPARSISYIEAHSAGTDLGDPIEIKGLTEAFKANTTDLQFCSIGSVKSNIGHTESTAGFAGIAKVLLQMQYKHLVPSIHAERLNPNINFNASPFYLQQEVSYWNKPHYTEGDKLVEAPRRAGVNAFGAGGANAHVLLEEYEENHFVSEAGPFLLPLSARSKSQVKEYAAEILQFIQGELVDRYHAMHTIPNALLNLDPDSFETLAYNILAKLLSIPTQVIDPEDTLADYSIGPKRYQSLLQLISAEMGTTLLMEYPDDECTIALLVERLKQVFELSLSNQTDSTNQLHSEAVIDLNCFLPSLCYTYQVGREAMKHRAAFVVEHMEDLVKKLQLFIAEEEKEGIYQADSAKDTRMDLSLLKDLFERKRLGKIARYWVQGGEVTWEKLYDSAPLRMPLPKYPFERQRCWVTEPSLPRAERDYLSENPNKQNNLQSNADLSGFYYRPVWQSFSLDGAEIKAPSSVLLIYPEHAVPIKNALIAALTASNLQEVVLARENQKLSDTIQRIDKTDPQAYQTLLARHWDVILFLGAMDQASIAQSNHDQFIEQQENGLYSLYYLARSLQDTERQQKTRLILYTSVSNNEPMHAAILGFSKALRRELPDQVVTTLNLPLTGVSIVDLNNYFKTHASKLIHLNLPAADLTFEHGQLLRQTVVPFVLPSELQYSFQQGGVQIIVGGSGNVGRKLTRYLLDQYNATVIWIGRSSLEAIQNTLSQFSEANVHYYSCNMIDREKLTKIFQSIQQKYGTIDSVVHSAMDFKFAQLKDLSLPHLKEGLLAKVDGIMSLSKVFDVVAPRRFIAFSSVEAYVGNVGWSAYSAACYFKDQYAMSLSNQSPYDVHVINWGYWEEDPTDRAFYDTLKLKGIHPITADEGMRVIESVIRGKVKQTFALNVEDQVLSAMGIHPHGFSVKSQTLHSDQTDPAPSKSEDLNDKLLVLSGEDRSELMKHASDKVLRIIAETLHIEPEKFDKNVDLVTYGVDSLIVLNVHQGLESVFGTLPGTLLIEKMTVNAITEYLLEAGRIVFQTSGTEAPRPGNRAGVLPLGQIALLRKIASGQIKNFFKHYQQAYQERTLEKDPQIPYATVKQALDTGNQLHHLLITGHEGKQVEVVLCGKGSEIVLFLPAAGLTAGVWIEQFMALSETYKMMVIHVPGSGVSQLVSQLNNAGIVATYLGILDALQLFEPVHLVASCFGGIAAQAFASQHPERVASLTLVGAFYENMPKEYRKRLQALGLTKDLSEAEAVLFTKTPDELTIDEINQLGTLLEHSIRYDFTYLDKHCSPDTSRDDMAQAVSWLEGAQCASSLVTMKYLNETLSLSTWSWLKKLQVPTLCISGEYDTLVSPETMKTMAQCIPEGQFVLIKNAGHYPFLTASNAFNKLWLRFVEKITVKEER